jgi:hypothetical protein
MEMTVFWDAVQYCLVKIDQHFRGAYCFHHQGYRRRDDGESKYINTRTPSKL